MRYIRPIAVKRSSSPRRRTIRPDDLDPPLGSRRGRARPTDGRRAARGRRPAADAADGRRAVRLHARRRAPLRDAADADRGADVQTTRGDRLVTIGRRAPPPGRRAGDDEPAGRRPRGRLRALDLRRRARPDLLRPPTAGHAAAGPQPAARPGRPATSPGRPRSTSRSRRCRWRRCPETFVHPAGYCQNVLATGRCSDHGHGRSSRGREAIVVECDHPRTIEIGGDRPDYHIAIAVDRETGVILRLVEIDRRRSVTRRRRGRPTSSPDAPLPPTAFEFVFPDRDDDALLNRAGARTIDARRVEPAIESTAVEARQLEVALDGGQLLRRALDLGALEPVLGREDPPDRRANRMTTPTATGA